MIGTTVGSYSISAKLGAGGMGEVFRATDTRLGREVAVKFSAEHFSDRFEREARAVAALNHPNICTLFDVGPNYLVMELVEGPTLAERIAEGAIPVDQALVIARQIAAALSAAHEQGIVHRDLKPGNIKIKPDGSVKVLDFGLAKIGNTPTASVVDSPTMSLGATQAGMILGTAAYMSPEQARGKVVDKRADIWAFGVVLFEMVTGRRLFEGDDISVTLASVIKEEPDWDRAPASLRRLLRRCLAKDASKRLHDLGDLDLLLEDSVGVAATPAAAAPTRRASWVWMSALGSALAVIGVLAIPAMQHMRETAPPEMRLEIATPATDAPMQFALSPDGRYIVFVASGGGPKRLWLRALDRADAQPMPGTDGADLPFWAPNSRSIGFFATGKLYRIDVDGGPPQALAANANSPRGGAWSPDGTILFAPSSSGPLSRIAASGGEPSPATKVDPPRHQNHRFPQFLPDGHQFLFFAQGGPDGSGVYLSALDGREPKRLTAADSAAAFLPPNQIVFVRAGALVARPLDIARGELTGEGVTLADPVGYDTTNLGAFSVSADGRVAYRTGGAGKSQLTWFDEKGKPVGVVGEPDSNALLYPELSPDGRRVAVARTVQNNQDVYLIDLVRGGFTRLTFDALSDLNPVWSHDGSQVAFMSIRTGVYNIYTKPSSGAGSDALWVKTTNTTVPLDWSKDFLLYYEVNPKTGRDLMAIDMRSKDRTPRVVANTPFEETLAQFSPDGRWVAYQTNESNGFEVVVQAFPEPQGKWQVSIGGGIAPRWRADSRAIYFIAPDGKLMSATVSSAGATFDASTPVALFQTRIVGGGSVATNRPHYAVRDGKFLINQLMAEAAPITLLLNWRPEQRK